VIDSCLASGHRYYLEEQYDWRSEVTRETEEKVRLSQEAP
jgi:hypothetical protein